MYKPCRDVACRVSTSEITRKTNHYKQLNISNIKIILGKLPGKLPKAFLAW